MKKRAIGLATKRSLPRCHPIFLTRSKKTGAMTWTGGSPTYTTEIGSYGAQARTNKVKFDLSADSMPISTWPLRFVTDVLGAEVVHADMWKPAID